MPIDNELKIKLQVENKKANKNLKDTSDAVKGVEDRANAAGGSMERMRVATSGLRRRVGALRNNLLLVSFALGGLGAAISKTVKLFGEQELAEKKLEAALGRTSQSLLDQASALQSVTTFGDENIIQAQALIAAFTDDEEAIKRATEATLDLAAAKGMDLFAAADLVAKTLGSSTNALSRYGIEVVGAVGSTERLNSLTGNLAETFGGQAAAQAETMSGSLKQLSNSAGDLGERIGKLLAPSVLRVANALSVFVSGADAFLEWADGVNTSTEAQTQLNTVTKESEELIKRISDKYGIATDSSMDFVEQMDFLRGELEESTKDNFWQGTWSNPAIQAQRDLRLQVEFLTKAWKDSVLIEPEITQMSERYTTAAEEWAEKMGKVSEFTHDANDAQLIYIESASKMPKAFSALAKGAASVASGFAVGAKATARLQQTAAVIDTYSAATAALAAPPKGYGPIAGPFMAAAIIAQGLGQVMQISQAIGEIKHAATGADFITNGPQMMMVGDNPSGQERVQVTPLGGDPNVHGPQGGGGSLTINIQGNLLTEEYVETELAEKISTAVRRGVDFGIS